MTKKSAFYRPLIYVAMEPQDWLMEGFALFLVLLLWGLPIFYFDQLPDRIPTHFDGGGNPDRWGSRNELWVVPAIGLVMYVLLTALSRYPHRFNYLTKITDNNAEYQYRLGMRMLRVVKISVLLLMVYVIWSVIQSVVAGNEKLPKLFFLLAMAASTAPMLWYFWKSGQKPAS